MLRTLRRHLLVHGGAMSALTPKQEESLLKAVRVVMPSAEYAPEQAFKPNRCTDFTDSCGCYSEYTQEPCELEVSIKGKVPASEEKKIKLRKDVEVVAENWAMENLEWTGCESCENRIWVNVRIFRKVKP